MQSDTATSTRQHYEDLDPDGVWELETATLAREDIVAFAEQYDPQPFHVDEDAARESMFGGLVASGLHTYCVCNRLATEAFFQQVAFLCGRGLSEFYWHRPVRPGDTLSGWVELDEMRVSESDPTRGYVDVEITGINQRDEVVISWTAHALVARRPQ